MIGFRFLLKQVFIFMSTVISNGYELPPQTDLQSLLDWGQGVRERLTLCAKEHLQERALRRAVARFDEATLMSQGIPSICCPKIWKGGACRMRSKVW